MAQILSKIRILLLTSLILILRILMDNNKSSPSNGLVAMDLALNASFQWPFSHKEHKDWDLMYVYSAIYHQAHLHLLGFMHTPFGMGYFNQFYVNDHLFHVRPRMFWCRSRQKKECVKCDITEVEIISDDLVDREVLLRQLPNMAMIDESLFSLEVFQYSLTMCIAPMMYFVDWTGLVHFIELWQVLGDMQVTHAYWSSVSPATNHILQLYESEGVVIKHQFSLLPANLRHRIFQYGQHLTYHDCLLKNKYSAKFTAFVDLDEIPWTLPESKASFLEVLHEHFFNNGTRLVAAVALQQRAAQTKCAQHNLTRSLFGKVDFDCYNSIQHSRGQYLSIKHIVRPRYVTRLSSHTIHKKDSGFTTVEITSKTYLFHFRRVTLPVDHLKKQKGSHTGFPDKILQKVKRSWQKRRLKLLGKDDSQIWTSEHSHIISELDRCSQWAKHNVTCWSYYNHCTMNITLHNTQMLHANTPWLVLEGFHAGNITGYW